MSGDRAGERSRRGGAARWLLHDLHPILAASGRIAAYSDRCDPWPETPDGPGHAYPDVEHPEDDLLEEMLR